LISDILAVAQAAAVDAGAGLKELWGQVEVLKTKDGIRDVLTRADLEAERRLVEIIRARFPDHHILTEESGRIPSHGESPYRWILDPLDGTTNYLHQVPYCAVSVACEEAGELMAGVVYAPFQDELFTAGRGAGAALNGTAIRVSSMDRLEESLLATGFPASPGIPLEPHLAIFARLLRNTQGVRRPGAAALNLAYVACGRFDAFWGADLKPWDIAAGMLLVREAGGRVAGYRDRQDEPFPTHLIASNGHLHELLNQMLNA
jgi:myo-inositol-1(or 4)-monophosphatase